MDANGELREGRVFGRPRARLAAGAGDFDGRGSFVGEPGGVVLSSRIVDNLPEEDERSDGEGELSFPDSSGWGVEDGDRGGGTFVGSAGSSA